MDRTTRATVVFGLAIGAGGTIASMVWPEIKLIVGLPGLLICLIVGVWALGEWLCPNVVDRCVGGRKLAPSLLIAFGLFCLVWGAAWYAAEATRYDDPLVEAKPKATAGKTQPPQPLTHWFKEDFSNTLKVKSTYKFQKTNGPVTDFEFQVYYDFNANSYFAGAYIPATTITYDVIEMISADYEKLADNVRGGVAVEAKGIGQQSKPADKLLFSRQFYFYHETPLTDRQKADLRDLYSSKNLEIDFRDVDWQMLQWMRSRNKGKG